MQTAKCLPKSLLKAHLPLNREIGVHRAAGSDVDGTWTKAESGGKPPIQQLVHLAKYFPESDLKATLPFAAASTVQIAEDTLGSVTCSEAESGKGLGPQPLHLAR